MLPTLANERVTTCGELSYMNVCICIDWDSVFLPEDTNTEKEISEELSDQIELIEK